MSGWNFGLDSVASTRTIGSSGVPGAFSSDDKGSKNLVDLESNDDRTFPLFGNNPYVLLAQAGGITLGTPEDKLDKLLTGLRKLSTDAQEKRFQELRSKAKKSWVAPHLIKLLTSSDEEIRANAAFALAEVGDERAVKPLVKLLNDQSAEVRKTAGHTLGTLGDKRAVKPLIATAKDNNPSVRVEVAWALGVLGHDSSLSVLLDLLKDPSSSVRTFAAGALSNFKGEKAFNALVQGLKDSSSNVRHFAASALGQMGDKRAAAPLTKLLLGDADPNVQYYAGLALGKLGDQTVIPILAERAKEANPQIRKLATQALGWVGGPKAYEPIYQRFSDESHDVRIAAIRAMSKLKDERAVGALIAKLSHKDDDWHAAYALGDLGDKRAVGPLLAVIQNPEVIFNKEYLMQYAAKALGQLGDQKAFDPLVKALKYLSEPGTIIYVVEALGKLGDPRAIKVLQDPSKYKYESTYYNDSMVQQYVDLALKELRAKKPALSQAPQGIRLENVSFDSAKIVLPKLPSRYAYLVTVEGTKLQKRFNQMRYMLLANLKPDRDYTVWIKATEFVESKQESPARVIKFRTKAAPIEKPKPKLQEAKPKIEESTKPKPKTRPKRKARKCLQYKPYSDECAKWQ